MTTFGERIVLTLWIGALWAIGYLAAPVLFNALEDRMLAGFLAGKMFTLVSYLGLVAGALLLTGDLLRHRFRPSWRGWVLAGMLVLVVVGEFVIQPMMAELKSQGIGQGSARADEFGRLHGVASLLYLVNSIAGLVLVAAPVRRGE